jgi:hypothetical protein
LGPLWIEAFRYHKWANLHLLDICAELSPDQMNLTAPGTYGTIAGTWLHLLAAEQRYLRRLGGAEPHLNEREGFPGVAILREQASRSGDELIEAAARITPDDTFDAKYEGEATRIHLGIVIIQSLHHGNDHRTHICSILGHHQISYGDMDVWAYGDATGAIAPITATT